MPEPSLPGPGVSTISAGWLAEKIDGTRPSDIRRDIEGLITDGRIPAGARLPTVRNVAKALGTSIGTVSDAWVQLRHGQLIETRRRGGTTVRDRRITTALDLQRALPDLALLPDRVAALGRSSSVTADEGARHGADPITPALRRAAVRAWPYRADAFTAVPGIESALHLVTAALLPDSATVAATEPLCARTASILRTLPIRLIPVLSDDEGPTVDSVARALLHAPDLFVYQPTVSVPTGESLSERRRDQLAALFSPVSVRVFEEDPAGALIAGNSLGTRLPHRVLRASQFARAFGPDLRTSLVAGTHDDIRAIVALQQTEGNTASALTQNLLARLLTDRTTRTSVARASNRYADRNTALLAALRNEGVDVRRGGGYFLWVPVSDPALATATLARCGLKVAPGSASVLDASPVPFVRIATTRVPDDTEAVELIARTIASAGRLRGAEG
jgi:DNA-binding transcriptional MocR family regulator